MKKILFLKLLIVFYSTILCAVPLENGLIAYYSFNSDFSDDFNAYDAVGYNGATRASTGGFQNSGALLLDGSDDYLKVSNISFNTSTGGANTVSFWMKWYGGASQMPIGFYLQDLYLCAGYFGFNSANSDVTGISDSGMANQWVHVTAVFYNGAPSPSTHSLYINGVKQTIQKVMGSTPYYYTMPDYFYLGTWSHFGYYFGGQLDEVMLFNRALSDTEVSHIYTNTPIPEPSSLMLLALSFSCYLLCIKFYNKI